ncbi:hypothetical protein CBL_21485 [Carabus blaptoides fortunei]
MYKRQRGKEEETKIQEFQISKKVLRSPEQKKKEGEKTNRDKLEDKTNEVLKQGEQMEELKAMMKGKGNGGYRPSDKREGKKKKLRRIGTWNVTSIQEKEEELVEEMEKQNIEILGITEQRIKEEE